MEKIILLHTNDLHSHLENWPRIRRYIDQRKREVKLPQEKIITVDLGDFVDRWHPLTEATNGQANVALMNQVHYDAVTIGNNEGVGNSHEELDHLYDQGNFDVLIGNLFDKASLQRPSWSRESKIIESNLGTKIGLIAFTAPFPLTYEPNGWDIRNPLELLPNLLQHLRPQVDVLVLLSHLGIGDDRLIAENFPEVDIILGAHTHHLFKNGEQVNGVQLAAAGKFGQYVGEVSIELDDQKNIRGTKARVIATHELTEFPEDSKEIAGYLQTGHRLLADKKVAKLPYDLSKNYYDSHSLIKETLKAVKMRGQTKAAILNSGLFLTDLPSGLINQDELHQTLPHPMHLIRVTLTGQDLTRLILEIEKNRNFLKQFPMIGMGFRGKIFGEVLYDGIRYDQVNHLPLWEGKPINPTEKYALTTVDHFLFIPFFPTIEIAGKIEFLFPEFIRTVLGDYLAKKYPIEQIDA